MSSTETVPAPAPATPTATKVAYTTFAAGVLLIASVFGLVLHGNIPATDYMNLVYMILPALGVGGTALHLSK